jgi:hypothetical protein
MSEKVVIFLGGEGNSITALGRRDGTRCTFCQEHGGRSAYYGDEWKTERDARGD